MDRVGCDTLDMFSFFLVLVSPAFHFIFRFVHLYTTASVHGVGVRCMQCQHRAMGRLIWDKESLRFWIGLNIRRKHHLDLQRFASEWTGFILSSSKSFIGFETASYSLFIIPIVVDWDRRVWQ